MASNLAELLIQKAIELLEKQGPAAVTLRSIAQGAHVSHMAPYRHFEDKDALLAAVAARGFRDLTTAMDKAAKRSTKPDVRLRAIGRAYVQFACKRPALYRLMFGPNDMNKSHNTEHADARAAAFARCLVAVDAFIEQANLTPESTHALAVTTWSVVHGLASLLIDGRIASLQEASTKRLQVTSTKRLIEQVLAMHTSNLEHISEVDVRN